MKNGAFLAEISEEKNDNLIEGFSNIELQIDNQISTLSYNKQFLDYEPAVLYIHGFADLFYNEAIVKEYAKHGIAFYGLDLRRHGRSIKNKQEKFFVEDVSEYFEDIDAAIYRILKRHNKIILKGFSMGGLISSLYAHKGFYRDHIRALILVSPLFRFSTSWFQDKILRPVVLFLAKFFPSFKYTVNMKKYKDYLTHSLPEGARHQEIPLYFGWFNAMHKAIAELSKNLNIKKPILVLSSDKSVKDLKKYNHDSDFLLDVKDMKKGASMLGKDVIYKPIAGAVHDIFSSKRVVVEEAYEILFNWLDKVEKEYE